MGVSSVGNNALQELEDIQNRSLAQQTQMIKLQTEYQDKKAALDAIAAVVNSDHQSDEKVIDNISQS
jgi:hypothetical protein